MPRTPAPPTISTAPVLAILVCHDGAEWLPLVLSALRRSTIRPRHVLAVDTGSTDDTPRLLAEAADPDGVAGPPILDGVITLSSEIGFSVAVGEAAATANERWGDPGQWIWLLHDDSAPEPDCLDTLLRAAETAPSTAVLGPLAVDWSDPRLVVEAGLSTDASGHRRPATPGRLGDENTIEQSTEVLAVPSAGALIERTTWEELGGFDREIPLLREDIDFGWRVNAAGRFVLCVPRARLRHVRAVGTGRRSADAVLGPVAAADRVHGLRTFLVNCSAVSYLFGLPRLVWLCLLRGLGFALLRNGERARAEFGAVGYLLRSRAELRAARQRRQPGGRLHGLFTSRPARLRAALRGGVVHLVRRRVASEAALGRLPENADELSAWIPPGVRYDRPRPVGPDALPAGATRSIRSRGAGLRRPAEVVAVQVPEQATAEPAEETEQRRPSPGRRGEASEQDLLFVEVSRRRVLSATVFAPPVVLLVLLTALAFVLNGARLGLDLAGGGLLPVGGLGEVWTTYLEVWHPVAGGTASGAPVALAVLGLAGAPFAPLGGPAALVAILLIGDAPLAALVAYAATRRLRVDRWVRAGAAAAYGLLPAATASVAQGRLDVVVVHILLPALIAGIVSVLTRADARWLSTSVLCALTLALIGAFSPLAHALGLAALLLGFVALPPPGHRAARGIPAVAIVVLLPLVLLVPWLPTLCAHPALLLHGLGGPVAGSVSGSVSGAELAGLDPGGPGGLPIGVAAVLAALVASVVRPTPRVVPGLAVFVLGVAGVALVQLVEVPPVRGGEAVPGYAGVPLLIAGAGLLAMTLGACVPGARPVPVPLARIGAVGGVALVLVLAAGGIATGREGPLRADGGWRLASSLTAELAATGRSVLVLGTNGEPTRQSGGRLPRYGDDALVPVAGSAGRLDGWRSGLLAGAREAVTSAAAAGVLFVVLPPGEDGATLRRSASDLVTDAPPTSDGRVVLRLTPSSGQVTVVSPEQARRAVSGLPPSGELMGGAAVAAVPARLPDVAVRVSDGPEGRLLVLAAEQQPGWVATVGGERVPIVPAWGHQVAVSVPARQAEVTVEYPGTLHNLLLLVQVAALLFTALTAIPGRRRA